MSWHCISPEETVEGFKSAVYPLHWTGLLMMHYGMTVKRMLTLAVSVRNMKALTVKRTLYKQR
jgi:hypothetical protein